MATMRIVALDGKAVAVPVISSLVCAADVHANPNLARTRSLASRNAVPLRSTKSATV
jgi:hypothetical protein